MRTTRRDMLRAATATAVTGALAACAGTNSRSASTRPKEYVLVHGAWHGGWCWRRVADRLRAAGHRVHAPTLTGLGERSHLLTPAVSLDTHYQDVVNLLEAEELEDVILVGHSYGGLVITGVADRIPIRLSHLVYLDAVIAGNGESWAGQHPKEVVEARVKAAQASKGLSLPVPKAAGFGVAKAEDQEWVDRRMTPHPFSTYQQKVVLQWPYANRVARTYIDCTNPASATLAATKTRVRADREWKYIEIATGHDAMVTAPAELTEILLGIG